MIDFPNAPTPGQIFNPGKGVSYIWDGTSWNIVTTGSPLTALSRNLIVNPCGRISQENGLAAGTTTSYFVADQWPAQFVASGAAVSVKSDAAVINPSGSVVRLLFKTTTAKASLAAGDYAAFIAKLEGVRVESLGYAGNTPVQSVLRFCFNGPAGTYSIGIRNTGAATVCWTGQFTITAGQANTDTTQVLIIPAPPPGYVWAGGVSPQIEMWFVFAAGTTFIAPANGWQAGQFVAGPGQFNLLGTVNNQAQIWDVGLYADPNNTGLPPQFQVTDYALDLFECQRYYQDIFTAWRGQVTSSGTTGYVRCMFNPPMRATPTAVEFASSQSSFPASSSLGLAANYLSFSRVANATTSDAFFQTAAHLSARM